MPEAANSIMAYTPVKGHTLLIPSGPNDHLFVILTGISTTLTHLLVNLTSIHANVPHDPTCGLMVGDHPFIRHPSYIAYEFARIEMASDLSNRVDAGKLTLSDPVSDALLNRIRGGIAVSQKCPKKFQTYFARNALNT